MEMVRGTTDPKLFSATEENLHEFAVNVRPLLCPTLYRAMTEVAHCSMAFKVTDNCIITQCSGCKHVRPAWID